MLHFLNDEQGISDVLIPFVFDADDGGRARLQCVCLSIHVETVDPTWSAVDKRVLAENVGDHSKPADAVVLDDQKTSMEASEHWRKAERNACLSTQRSKARRAPQSTA